MDKGRSRAFLVVVSDPTVAGVIDALTNELRRIIEERALEYKSLADVKVGESW